MIFDSIYVLISTALNLLKLVVLGYAIYGFVDALRRSEAAFEIIGRGQKPAWLVGLALSGLIIWYSGMFSFFGLLATVAVIVYHVDIRARLNGKLF